MAGRSGLGSPMDVWAGAVIGQTLSDTYTGTQGTVDVSTMGNYVEGSLYRIVCSTDAFVAQDTSSIATTTGDMPLFIGQEAYAIVAEGVGNQPSGYTFFGAVQQSAGGTLYVTNIGTRD